MRLYPFCMLSLVFTSAWLALAAPALAQAGDEPPPSTLTLDENVSGELWILSLGYQRVMN